MAEWRAVADSKPAPTPSMISENCKNMVLTYTNKRYQDDGGYNDAEAFSRMVMRLLPRPFIEFSHELFPEVNTLDTLDFNDVPFSLFRRYRMSSPELARI